MDTKSLMIASQLTLIPVTIVFFILLGQLLINQFSILKLYSNTVILTLVIISLIISALELYFVLKNVNQENTGEDPELIRLEKQREMILKVFGDKLDEEDVNE